MAATVLYLLKAAVPLAMKCRPDNSLNELYKQGLAEISQKKLGEKKPPLAALDYRTLEGSCGEKKHKQKFWPWKYQMRSKRWRHVENLKICEAQHSKDNISSMFQMECDAVVEMLMQEKAKSFDTVFNKIPTAMRPDSLSPSSAYTDDASSAVRLLVKGKEAIWIAMIRMKKKQCN